MQYGEDLCMTIQGAPFDPCNLTWADAKTAIGPACIPHTLVRHPAQLPSILASMRHLTDRRQPCAFPRPLPHPRPCPRRCLAHSHRCCPPDCTRVVILHAHCSTRALPRRLSVAVPRCRVMSGALPHTQASHAFRVSAVLVLVDDVPAPPRKRRPFHIRQPSDDSAQQFAAMQQAGYDSLDRDDATSVGSGRVCPGSDGHGGGYGSPSKGTGSCEMPSTMGRSVCPRRSSA